MFELGGVRESLAELNAIAASPDAGQLSIAARDGIRRIQRAQAGAAR